MTEISQSAREAADKALDIAFRGDTSTIDADMAALFVEAEQRGALAERERAAGIAENIGLSLDQIVEWADLSKLQFADKVAQHIAQVIRTGAKP